MPTPATLALFVAAVLVFLVIPGPAVLFIVARTLEGGRAAGFASVAGLVLGTTVHVAAAALGVSAALVASATAFATVKYAGAAYLVYLGVRKLAARDDEGALQAVSSATPDVEPQHVAVWPLLRQAALVNVLNPKAALFFLAFLPQFIHPEAGPTLPQLLVLSALYVVLSVVTDGGYVLLASGARQWVRSGVGRTPRARRAQRCLLGGTYIGLGAVAALAGGRGAK